MAEMTGRSSGEDENVSDQIPKTDIDAAALRPVVTDLLQSIPATWAEFGFDALTHRQANALFLLTAAGMVERRGWIRTTIANHSTCFELRFQTTGEIGIAQALERAATIELETWGEAWRKWRESEASGRSPFHVQSLSPQEWRLTDQGELAREELRRATCEADRLTVLDFVLKCGLYGPGYWERRFVNSGYTFSDNDQRILAGEYAAGHDVGQLPRPPVNGCGQLLEIRKVDPQGAGGQPVSLTNWSEGATAFANEFGRLITPMFEAMTNAQQNPGRPHAEGSTTVSPSPGTEPRPSAAPVSFQSGDLVFSADRVTLCGVEICRGARQKSRRVVLELLSRRRNDGSFKPLSGEELKAEAVQYGAKGNAAGWIRDLRADISEGLRSQANIVCGSTDVILSGDSGYRFSDSLTVQFVDPPEIKDITDITDTEDRGDVPSEDVRDVFDVRDDAAGARHAWILAELAIGRRLKAPDVAEHFSCSVKTAQRDLTALKDDGKIEFVGSARTGFYRTRPAPKAP